MNNLKKLAKKFQTKLAQKTSYQAADITLVLCKSGILGWQTDCRSLREAPPMDLQSKSANAIFTILDKAGSDNISNVSISVDASGRCSVNVGSVLGGNKNLVISEIKRYFDPKMTAVVQRAGKFPAGTTTLKWIKKIGYK